MSNKVLVIIAAVLVFGEMPVAVSAQWMFDPSGFFYLKGEPSKGFEDFGSIALSKSTPTGPKASSSYLSTKTGASFKFVRLNTDWTPASQGRPFFEFVTDSINGVGYAFKGRFLDNRVFATNITDPETVVAAGELTKFINGKTIAGATVQLTYYARLWNKDDELMFSAKRGDFAAVKALLGQGADAKAMGPYALSVLEYGVSSGNKEVVRAILAAGADVNAVNKKNETALMKWSSQTASAPIVKALLRAGADVNARAESKATALSIAEYYRNEDIVRTLKEAGAKKSGM